MVHLDGDCCGTCVLDAADQRGDRSGVVGGCARRSSAARMGTRLRTQLAKVVGRRVACRLAGSPQTICRAVLGQLFGALAFGSVCADGGRGLDRADGLGLVGRACPAVAFACRRPASVGDAVRGQATSEVPIGLMLIAQKAEQKK